MKTLFTFYALLLTFISIGQNSYVDSITQLRIERNQHMLDSTSFLNEDEKAHFVRLDFFEVDSNWVITAGFRKDVGDVIKMKTSTSRRPKYRRYGYLSFYVGDSLLEVPVYQNMNLLEKEEYENYLFFPIDDYTIPDESYPTGRYLDINKPEKGDSIVLDFNMLYNPYCAYSYRYSCPVTPRENKVHVRIEAGEKIPILREDP
ncbi:hypothetical protein SAMN05216474_0395 [Lishizhenia tianjinensis]|uniref:DUF1684 domain-containing protein n=1 Tax=Lishizhenia tianjinensis TaxID=477690 RepID=A0A1I6XSB3_9FLAO|nr:DUF1684 domain-containing protein [Lishizhenia tianjinensis]SFT40811.1 hypothetical protein SAMN05216474_0395 [Lishizhenia tianjinensis]